MEGSEKVLRSISLLVERLIRKNERLAKENSELLSERERLIREKVRLTEQLEKYKHEQRVKDIYTSFVVGEGDKLRAKRQLEKILREIDGCIVSLSSKQ